MAFGARGQAFDTYRLLLGAIMGLLVLLIILGAVSYFEGLRVDVSRQRFFDGLKNAANQPNGDTLELGGIYFLKDSRFSSKTLARNIGLAEECVAFSDNGAPGFTIGPELAKVDEQLVASVFVRCETNYSGACEIGCEISFGEPFH